jgi:alpha-L-arabinofuranosidase
MASTKSKLKSARFSFESSSFILRCCLVIGCLCFPDLKVQAESATITMDAAKRGAAINPQLYGIFLEEINHAVDGGLYAELIRNRSFEDSRPPEGYTFRNGRWRDARGFDSGFSRYGYTTNGVPFWSLIQEGAARGSINLETTGGVTEQSAYCARLDVAEPAGGRIGIANEGFFGIGMHESAQYSLSLFARRDAEFKGSLRIRLEDANGVPCSDEAKFDKLGTRWQPLRALLRATNTNSKARLAILAASKGSVWLDFVSLFPETTWKNRPNGLRPDIAQMIADLKPGFVRFPGGCVVEAGTIETAYDWKLTVGPLTQRAERWGPWNYRRTQGMGLFEYLQFCEDLVAAPLYVGFAGQTCIFRERELVPMDQMGWVRDNFLDVIEYANGGPDSKWGKLRSVAGHAAPFGLKLVEIGNENQGREFAERYRFIYDAMKARYPELTYLADLSWTSRDSMGDAKFDIEDQHYYNSPRWFQSRFNEYDGRDRKLPPLYLGEVAVTSREGGPLRGNLLAALAEGIFLMGCERNADAVQMVSYAPLLAHVEGRTELTGAPPPWHAQIYFDGTRVFGTASYYLWKLFSQNRPSYTIKTDLAFPDAKPVVVAGQTGVGTWDATAEFKDVRVERDGKLLYQSDFSQNAEGWKPDSGQWSTADGAYQQSRRGQGLSYFGDENWSDYTLTLKARKHSGGEGFLIVFGRGGPDKYWWNLGGWGNSQHGIEFNQTPVGRPVRGRIENDRWYDIKIALSGKQIRCYLDNELIHDATAPSSQKFFTIAGHDDATGNVVVKAINISDEKISANLKLLGIERVTHGSVSVLQSSSLLDNNSLTEPMRVVPRESRLESVSRDFAHEFPARSLTVLQLQTR